MKKIKRIFQKPIDKYCIIYYNIYSFNIARARGTLCGRAILVRKNSERSEVFNLSCNQNVNKICHYGKTATLRNNSR